MIKDRELALKLANMWNDENGPEYLRQKVFNGDVLLQDAELVAKFWNSKIENIASRISNKERDFAGLNKYVLAKVINKLAGGINIIII